MRHEYVVNLRQTQRTSKITPQISNTNSSKISINNIVLVYDEKVPRQFWRISIVTRVLPCRNSEIRGVIVDIAKANTIFKRFLNRFFTIENTYHDTSQTDKAREQS